MEEYLLSAYLESHCVVCWGEVITFDIVQVQAAYLYAPCSPRQFSENLILFIALELNIVNIFCRFH